MKVNNNDTVYLRDSEGTVVSKLKVKTAGKSVIRTTDGRRFLTNNGWWIGENRAWPFPYITKTNRYANPKPVHTKDK